MPFRRVKEVLNPGVVEFRRGPYTSQITVKVHSIERSRIKKNSKRKREEENRPTGRFLEKSRAKGT